MAPKVAVVTGSNKGIGFAIVCGLAKAFQGDFILTARNEERGLQAVEDLKLEGFEVKFHQLDIDHEARDQSIKTLEGTDVKSQYIWKNCTIHDWVTTHKLNILSIFTLIPKDWISISKLFYSFAGS